MDISFHYFAIKTAAMLAGYKEWVADCIAEYSQFVDDFNWHDKIFVRDVPDYVLNNNFSYLKVSNFFFGKNIEPVTTDSITTSFRNVVARLPSSVSQQFILSPFHFIPQSANRMKQNDYKTYPAVWGDGSYISVMLEEAVNEVSKSVDVDSNDAFNTLKFKSMHVGMLLHIFADTYAHQKFTGRNTWENNVKLLKVINNVTGIDETDSYKLKLMDWINDYNNNLEKFFLGISDNLDNFDTRISNRLNNFILGKTGFSVGHMLLMHVPDLSHITFTMEYKESKYGSYISYEKNNTEIFVNLCKNIINILRYGLGKTDMPESEWNKVKWQFKKAFLINVSNCNGDTEICELLKAHWSKIFGYYYNYDSNVIKKRFEKNLFNTGLIGKLNFRGKSELEKTFINLSDDFYRYNIFADKILVSLYGKTKR